MTTLADLYTDVSVALQRGTSQDTAIPGWARRAVSRIEIDGTYAWMRKSASVSLDPLASRPDQISMPSSRVKGVDFIKIAAVNADGSTTYSDPLIGVDAMDVLSIDLGVPNGFYLDGVDYIYLDSRVQQTTNLWLRYFEYTDWPTSTAASPAILVRAYDYLFNQIMCMGATTLKDERMFQTYELQRQQAREAAIRAEGVLEFKHQNDLRQEYQSFA